MSSSGSSSPASSSSSSYSSSSASSTLSSVHPASLVDAALHSPHTLRLVNIKISKQLIDHVVDQVIDTVEYAMGKTPLHHLRPQHQEAEDHAHPSKPNSPPSHPPSSPAPRSPPPPSSPHSSTSTAPVPTSTSLWRSGLWNAYSSGLS
ncbi:hypothetical protein NMY22_g9618 [Coprinellus aureogranulatus]|nr:hypothetical protein NMY22_g9618 [Coprinellus aureogranulatus]